MKKLIALISPEGKTKEQLANEANEAIQKYFRVEKKVLSKMERKEYVYVFGIIGLALLGYAYFSYTTKPTLNIPQFKDFPVSETYHGTPAPVDLNSSPIGHTFRTVLTAGAKTGPNFAGHYTIVTWGCGSTCQDFAVADAKTGKIYDVPFGSENGTEFRLDSRLLIVNPLGYDKGGDGSVADWVRIQYYEWTGEEFKLLEAYKVSDNQMIPTRLP